MRALSAFAVGCLLILTSGATHAAEIRVLSGNGARAAMQELIARFERASGHKVSLHFEVNAALHKKIEAGERFDVAILNPGVLDALIKHGKVRAETRAGIGRAGLGVGVRAGAPKPDIGTLDAFKHALVSANGVAYPGEGASGKYFVSVVERLGLTAQMKSKMRPSPAEDTVEVVARGEVDLVVVVASRIANVPGVELVGPIPAEVQTWIGFAAGVANAAKEPAAAEALVRFLAAPEAAPVLKSLGVEPLPK